MLKSIFRLSFILITLTSINNALNVTNINKCPTLTPRNPPTNVNDLRVDDIKVIGALGDGVSAGLGIMGFKKTNDIIPSLVSVLLEYRGLNYNTGGDEDAFSIANYIKHYQPNLKGSSIGQRLMGICNGDNCFTSNERYHDNLDAALSSALAMNLDKELDYLISTMKSSKDIDFENDWKMINIQIGSNDMCDSCKEKDDDDDRSTPEKYGEYVEAAVDKIYANIPKVLVNLIGNYNLADVFPLTFSHKDYCILRNGEGKRGCACGTTLGGLDKMKKLSAAYDNKLMDIYIKYQRINSKYFTVVYQHNNYDVPKFSMEFFSTFDCFHPSLKGHQWTSKIIWNQLFVPQSKKPNIFVFDESEIIYCPVDSDRIITY